MITFKPNQATLMAALEKIPGVTMGQTENYITLSRGDYTLYIRKPDPRRELPTYKYLWDEDGHFTPRTIAHLRFRYEGSQALRAADEATPGWGMNKR